MNEYFDKCKIGHLAIFTAIIPDMTTRIIKPEKIGMTTDGKDNVTFDMITSVYYRNLPPSSRL
jgi:hypothetical protein